MGRAVPLVVTLLILVAAFFLPQASVPRLSALQAYELLDLPVGDEPAEGETDERKPLWQVVLDREGERTEDGIVFHLGRTIAHPRPARRLADRVGAALEEPAGPDGKPLWKVVLEGEAAERTPEGITLKLYGLAFKVSDPGLLPDLDDHYAARLSLVAALRELAAADPDTPPLTIDGEHGPKRGGANFTIQVDPVSEVNRYREEITYYLDANIYPGAEPVVVPRYITLPAQDDVHLRRSILRGLRQFSSANPEYMPLVIEGENEPHPRGVNFALGIQENEFSIEHSLSFHGLTDTAWIRASRTWTPPDKSSIVPPIVAVALAILFRRPLVALFLAVFSGAYLMRRGAGEGLVAGLGGGFYDTGMNYFKTELLRSDRLWIIGFVVFMLAMVGVMTRSGGIRGLMDAVAARADSVKKTQIATWIMGLVIFFDDYANTILVGSTMRPLTDRFRISREKLSFIVDSTAAPVAGLSIFSTWIAFEVSTFNHQLPAAGLDITDGYAVFLRTIPYSFYCFLTLFFVGLLAFTGRDLGPMLTAERRARSKGQLLRPGATPMVSEKATTMEPAGGVAPRAWRAVLPLLAFIGVTLFEIARAGGAFALPAAQLFTIEGITQVLYDGSGNRPLCIGGFSGFLVAAIGAATAGLTVDILKAAWTTLRAMGVAFAILYLAWMIGAVCSDLGTAPFLTAILGDALDARVLPSLLFLLAGIVAFATGSSWSTMSILLPLVVGLAYGLGIGTDLADTEAASGQLLMVMSIGAVLSGAIFGDHCSPISDTTVMSSIASASDHIDHVRTQAPYALLTMSASIACGYLPAAYLGLSPWLGLGMGAFVLVVVVAVFGRRSETAAAEPT